MNYFLDTNICIYFLQGRYENILIQLKKNKADNIKIPAIVKAELLYGAYKSQQKNANLIKVENFLGPFQIMSFNDQAADVYAAIRAGLEKKGNLIGPNDLIIAATVLSNNGTLVTNNEKEFSRIAKLRIQNWTK